MVKRILEKILILLSILSIAFITISNLFFTSNIVNNISEIVNINRTSVISLILSILIIFVFLILCFITKRLKFSKKINVVLFVCASFLYIFVNVFWIQTTKAEPVADQRVVNQIANEIVNGNNIEKGNIEYIERNPQQIGMAYFIATIYTVFNSTNYHIIQYFNVISNVISIICLYLMMKKSMKKYPFNGYMYFIICFSFIPLILLSSFVYGDYIGLMFSISSVYMITQYVDKKKLRYMFISAILLSISYIVKTNYLIFILAIIIYLVLDFLNEKNLKKILIIILFTFITILPNTILQNVVTNELKLNKDRSIPTSAYIYMAMSEGEIANGWYNSTMDYAYKNIDDASIYYPKKIKERINEFIFNPLYTIKFYSKKVISMWTEVRFGGIWYNLPFQEENNENFDAVINENHIFLSLCQGRLNQILEIFQKAVVLLLFLGALIAVYVNRKNINIHFILLLTIFLGGFFFHIIWEAKSRYILPYIVILIPISVVGIQSVCDHIKKKI